MLTVLPSITAAETNYLAFKVYTTDYHIQLYGWLQQRDNCPTVKGCDTHITQQRPKYNPAIHSKPSSFGTTTYATLPTYIRNAIDHPDQGRTYTKEELQISTELLRDILS